LSDPSTLYLTEALRRELKEPLGKVVVGTADECNELLRSAVNSDRPPKVILVGDTVSRNALESGFKPDVIIVDNREMRRESVHFSFRGRKQFKIHNAQGTIDSTAWNAVAEALRTLNSVLIADGEEDLLALVAISLAPDGSLVVYGQPGEGIVLVNVTPAKKDQIAGIVGRMERRTT